MADYYRKIVNTLLITGAEQSAQRQKVYEKARAQAQEDIKQAESNDIAAKISADLEDAIRRAEIRFAAEEKNKKAAAAMPVVRIVNYKSIIKKTSGFLLAAFLIIFTIGFFYAYPHYLTQIKDLALSYVKPTISTKNDVSTKDTKPTPEQSAKPQTNNKIQTEKKVKESISSPALEKPSKQNAPVVEAPKTPKESPATHTEKSHIQPSTIINNEGEYLSYDAIKQCAQDFLFIDKQWENLNNINKKMQKKSSEINRLEQQKEHRLAIASAQAEYNKLVKHYNKMVDTLNANSVKLNDRCADKNINYDDLTRICQKGSPYHQSSFCESMM